MRKYEAKQGRRHLGATGVRIRKRDLKIGIKYFYNATDFVLMHAHTQFTSGDQRTNARLALLMHTQHCPTEFGTPRPLLSRRVRAVRRQFHEASPSRSREIAPSNVQK